MSIDHAKRAAGRAAAALIQPGMIVGLGTGSTAAYFIEALAECAQQGLVIQAVVASSRQSFELGKRLHLPMQDLNAISLIDLTVDGADEIDAKKRMIKGGGGAHVREKILASSSQEMIVIIDETKLVPSIGTCKLPVEVCSFGANMTRKKLEALGYRGSWRQKDSNLFVTDNGNLLLDIQFPFPPPHPEQDHEHMIHIPGVIDTGFFFNLAGRIVIGYRNGHFEIY